jgi:hypothetical protein
MLSLSFTSQPGSWRRHGCTATGTAGLGRRAGAGGGGIGLPVINNTNGTTFRLTRSDSGHGFAYTCERGCNRPPDSLANTMNRSFLELDG